MSDLDGLREKEDVEGGKEIVARVLTFKTFRCFYMALSYASASKWSEAMALLDRALEETATAKQHHAACASPSQGDIQRLSALDARIRGEKCVLVAKAYLQSQRAAAASPKEAEAGKKGAATLGKTIDEFSTAALDNKTLAEFPPSFQTISCKPLFFDLALVAIEYPALEKRAQAPKKGGLFSFLRS